MKWSNNSLRSWQFDASWFVDYCCGSDVASALINREPLPEEFINQVHKKIEYIDKNYNRASEHIFIDNLKFMKEHDEQLLQWLSRWVILIINNYCINY